MMIAERLKDIQKDLLVIDEARKRIYAHVASIERVAFYKPLTEKEVIQRCVLQHFEVSLQEIRSKLKGARSGEVIKARQVLAAMLRRRTKMSLAQVGDIIGRDHATVNHSSKVLRNAEETKDLLWDEYCVINDNVEGLISATKIQKERV